jgi:hypothetical protein
VDITWILPTSGTRNLAIKGLFNYIDPNGREAAALVAQGYKKTNWGASIVANEGQYTTSVFKGYTDAIMHQVFLRVTCFHWDQKRYPNQMA